MSVTHEDTAELVSLIKQNESLYDDCYRITMQNLEQHPPSGSIERGIGNVTGTVRGQLAATLRTLVRYSDAKVILDHLECARVDWRDVAAEFIADVLLVEQEPGGVRRK